MNQSETALLQRIKAYQFDVDGATKSFKNRLARENVWSEEFAERVIEEYRRFAFLVAATNQLVSPSDVIDQAWHLHLLYTRTYWDEFCRNVLGRPLHHEPSAGLPGQDNRFEEQYRRTLDNYRKYFGEPPIDIWPSKASKHRPMYRRVDVAGQVVIPVSTFYRLLFVLLGVAFCVIVFWALNLRS